MWMARAHSVAEIVSKDTRFAERFPAAVGRGARSVAVVETVVLENRRVALLWEDLRMSYNVRNGKKQDAFSSLKLNIFT
jgi:hypothetical protein